MPSGMRVLTIACFAWIKALFPSAGVYGRPGKRRLAMPVAVSQWRAANVGTQFAAPLSFDVGANTMRPSPGCERQPLGPTARTPVPIPACVS